MTPNLDVELAAARQVFVEKMPNASRWLFGAGLSQPLPAFTKTAAFQRVGLAGIVIEAAGRWSPSAEETGDWADGALAIIVPVLDAGEELVDLLAWRRDKDGGGSWWLRTGEGAVLGAPACAWCAFHDQPLRLHADPRAWLACCGDGACILNYASREAEGLIRSLKTIEIDPAEREFATWFHKWLRQPVKRHHPDIFLRPAGGEPAAVAS